MSEWKREMLTVWAAAFAYVLYMAAIGGLCMSLFGEWGAIPAIALSLGPFIAWTLREPKR